MRLRKIFRLASIVIMTLALTGCNNAIWSFWYGLDNNDDATNTTQSIELSQTASVEDPTLGTLSVNYPDGWGVEAEGVITLANDPAILEQIGGDEGPADGQVGGVLVPFDGAALGNDMSAAFDAISGFMFPEGFEPETSEATFGDNSGMVASGSSEIAGAQADLRIYFVQIGANYVIAQFVSTEGGMGDFADTLDSIVATVSLTSAE